MTSITGTRVETTVTARPRPICNSPTDDDDVNWTQSFRRPHEVHLLSDGLDGCAIGTDEPGKAPPTNIPAYIPTTPVPTADR